ncbi:diguanylate cyclase [Vibrio sp. CAIM 722]|uniref:diguanylate cyclase n=1 Tax=Vibrio eleionomae TaxID=2653505 RepID=A0A7X4RVG4_9VIBR|nr:diguanylate cyclase [Vibrio eleionomae]MZI94282.1 diguanylate cyclase [Vibrio eleionomae]
MINEQKYFSATSVVSTISWLIISMVITSICLIVFFFHIIDNQTKQEMIGRVQASIKHDSLRMIDLSYEYTSWNLGYQKTIIEHDVDWMKLNYTEFLPEHYNLSFIALVKPNHQAELLGGINKQALKYVNDIFQSPSINRKLALAKQRDERFIGHTFYTVIDGDVFYMIADPFIDKATQKVLSSSLLAFARKLDPNEVMRFANEYDLPPLYINAHAKRYDGSIFLHELNGVPVARISWHITEIIDVYLPYIALFLLLLLGAALAIVRLVLKKDSENRAQYEDELYIAATTDPLTKVYNKRYLASYAKHQFKLYEQRNRPISILALDLDHFKQINDTYGHHIGDKALIHFCKQCEKNLRDIDVLGRIGGEEFAILLPRVTLNEAIEVGERIRQSIEKNPLNTEQGEINLTVSIGVTTRCAKVTFSKLLQQADSAMYQAKRSGRNQVVAYETPLCEI